MEQGGSLLQSLAGIGKEITENVVNYYQAEAHADNAQKRSEQLMNKQAGLNQALSRNAYANQVEGMRMAGLNPAMLNGQSVTAPSVGLNQGAKAENVELDPNASLTLAQLSQVEAETEKVKAEAKAQENINSEWEASNDAAKTGMVQDFNTEIEYLEKELFKYKPDTESYNKIEGRINDLRKMRDKLSDENYRGAVGILKGTSAAKDNARDRMNILTGFLKGTVDRSVALKQLDNGTVKALADMPKLTRDKLAEDIEHVKQMIAESESKEKLNDQMVSKLSSEIESIGLQILQSKLNDENYIRFMAENAETEDERDLFKKSLLKNLTDTEKRKWAYETGSRAVSGLVTGGAIGAAGGAASNMTRNIGNKKSGMDKFDDYMSKTKQIRDNQKNIDAARKSQNPFSYYTNEPGVPRSGAGYEFQEGVQQLRKYKRR